MLWSILDEYLFIACLATVVTISFFRVIILWTLTFAEVLEATPDCIGRSIIDDPVFDSSVYTIIGSKCHCIIQYELIYNLITYDFSTYFFDSIVTLHVISNNAEEELDQSKISTIQMTNLIDDDILYNDRGKKVDTLLCDQH
jgi:hypothetical protein